MPPLQSDFAKIYAARLPYIRQIVGGHGGCHGMTFNQLIDDFSRRIKGNILDEDIEEHIEQDPKVLWKAKKLRLYLETWDVAILEEIILKRATNEEFTDKDFALYDRYVKLRELASDTEFHGERRNAEGQAQRIAERLAGIAHLNPEGAHHGAEVGG